MNKKFKYGNEIKFHLNDGWRSPLFTKQEKIVIGYLLNGLTLSEISIKTVKSIKTISAQKRSVYSKLEVKNDIELIKKMIELQIVSIVSVTEC